MSGADPVRCEVYGRDLWGRALAECFQHGDSINAAAVLAGWALPWYPSTGAVLGPRYDDAQAEAAEAGAALLIVFAAMSALCALRLVECD